MTFRELPTPNRYYRISRANFLLFVEALFIAFFLLVLVRVEFNAAVSDETKEVVTASISAGDFGKQIGYTALLLLFCIIYILRIPDHQSFRLKCVSKAQIAILAWFLLSSNWAISPGVSLRRSVLLTMVFSCLAIAIDTVGVARSIRCLYIALAIVVIASIISVAIFPFAIHPGDESDSSLVGCWRGIMSHKNIAGGVCGMSVIVFLHHVINRGKWFDWILLICSLVFICGTRSKTAIGFLVPIIIIGLIYRTLWQTPKGRIQFCLLVGGILVCCIVAAFVFQEKLSDVFANPKAFTGRITIWRVALMEIRDHPFLGSGYSAFWSAGPTSSLYHYILAPFIEFTQHSHNGFIEIAVVSGIPGFALALFASVILPLKQIFNWDRSNVRARAMLFSIVLFGIAENLFETQLFAKDKQVWIVFCASILLLQQLQSQKRFYYRRSSLLSSSYSPSPYPTGRTSGNLA